ncbi:hypothetical protein C1O25_16600 [Vibrio diazotrophicus]|uniref:Secreted protein n=1 Tax=Vibrio diazotrophicus TaxID=685 RepID=A0ABX4W9S6_VIBDI|nr:hypothetical protein C1O25_16600 [Vibrio diazotrophicus]
MNKKAALLFLFEAAVALAEFVRPNHIVIYAYGDSLICRLPAVPSSLSKKQLPCQITKILYPIARIGIRTSL